MSSASHSDASGVIIKCEGCDKTYKVHLEKLPSGVSSFSCRACGTLVPISSQAQVDKVPTDATERILIAVEEEELGKLIQRILGHNGYQGFPVTSGKEVLAALRGGGYDLLLISVYLPDMMSYELLDQVAVEQSATKIPSILLSAVHHAARYKRAPTSLYGADDYVERHHLPDLLVPKIRRLLSSDDEYPGKVTPGDVPPPTDEQVLVKRDLETLEKTVRISENLQMGEVQRMCRVIVGDIALYNEDVIASTPPGDLLNAIASDLSEGEALLMSRFPEMEDQFSPLLRGEMLRLLNSRGIQIS